MYQKVTVKTIILQKVFFFLINAVLLNFIFIKESLRKGIKPLSTLIIIRIVIEPQQKLIIEQQVPPY